MGRCECEDINTFDPQPAPAQRERQSWLRSGATYLSCHLSSQSEPASQSEETECDGDGVPPLSPLTQHAHPHHEVSPNQDQQWEEDNLCR